MGDSGLRSAVAANASWLKTIRLVDRAELVWLAISAVLCIALLFVLAAVVDPLGALLGAAAHGTFIACIYLAAARPWLWRLALIVCLSQLNLLIYIWSSGPQLWLVLTIYGYLALLALASALAVELRSRRQLHALGPGSSKDDFRWLVTRGPLARRVQVRKLLRATSHLTTAQ